MFFLFDYKQMSKGVSDGDWGYTQGVEIEDTPKVSQTEIEDGDRGYTLESCVLITKLMLHNVFGLNIEYVIFSNVFVFLHAFQQLFAWLANWETSFLSLNTVKWNRTPRSSQKYRMICNIIPGGNSDCR